MGRRACPSTTRSSSASACASSDSAYAPARHANAVRIPTSTSTVRHALGESSNGHSPLDLPVLLLGGWAGQLEGGRHIRYEGDPLMPNLLVTLMDKLGVPSSAWGRATGGSASSAWPESRASKSARFVDLGRLLAPPAGEPAGAVARFEADSGRPRSSDQRVRGPSQAAAHLGPYARAMARMLSMMSPFPSWHANS